MFGESLLERLLAESADQPVLLFGLALVGLSVLFVLTITRSRRKLLLDLELVERLLELREKYPDDMKGRTLDVEAPFQAAQSTYQLTYSWPAAMNAVLRLFGVITLGYTAYMGYLGLRLAAWAGPVVGILFGVLAVGGLVFGIVVLRHAGRPDSKEADEDWMETINRRVLEPEQKPVEE